MKRIGFVIFFARPHFIWHQFFSLLAYSCLIKAGWRGLLFALGIKLAGYLTVISYHHFTASYSYNYFHNAGYRVRSLYSFSFAFDLFVFLITSSVLIFVINATAKG